MKRKILSIGRIIPIIIFFLFTGNIASAQEEKVTKEPVKEQIQMQQSGDLNEDNLLKSKEVVVSDQYETANVKKADEEAKKNKTSTTAKQVKSSRPDLTKSAGARPPTIVRPSGSGIPKGAGKPGGAVAPGRR